MKKRRYGTGFVMLKRGFLAFGLAYRDGTFTVARGSNFRNQEAPNLGKYRGSPKRLREHLKRNKFVSKRKNEPNLIFGRAYKFRNISECTSVLLGSSRSGDSWVNAYGVAYPEWIQRNREAHAPLKVGTKFKLSDDVFEVEDIIENLDDKSQFINEYYLVNSRTNEKILVPELLVLRDKISILEHP